MLPPPRPRRSPLILLIALAAIPAIALGYTWRWAEAKIPADATGAAEVSGSTTTVLGTPPPSVTGIETTVVSTPTSTEPSVPGDTASTPDTGPIVPVPVGAMNTPLLSVRRAPQSVVQLTSESSFVTTLQQISAYIPDSSCLVASLAGRQVFDHNGDVMVTPASNQKLLVAAVALETLGPDHTFSTRLFGTVAEGVVTSDLYFVGGGDPLLSTAPYPETQEYPPTDVTPLEQLVANLVGTGITRIAGNVIADESRYDNERYVPTWGNDIRNTEAGPLSALMVNDASRRVQPGNTARVQDPAVGAATELITLLKAAGISVNGSARAGVLAPDITEITSIQSAPLSAVIGEMLTTSDDNTAELLLKELAVAGQTGNTRQAGLDVVSATLASWGIDPTKLVLVDGSGLDGGNRVTCNIMRQVLTHQPLDGPIGAGLAIDGQTGTLAADTALGPAMVGRLRAKTGTLSDVKSLTGFVTTDAGTIEFSMILNLDGVGENYAGLWTALGDAFSKYPAGPTVDDIAPR